MKEGQGWSLIFKSFSLGRGVRLNICKRGLSVSGGTSGLRAGGSPSDSGARFGITETGQYGKLRLSFSDGPALPDNNKLKFAVK